MLKTLLFSVFALTLTSGERVSRPFIQADVYNALFEARRHCDEGFQKSRTEFIVDISNRYRGQPLSLDRLKVLLSHKIEIEQQSITDLSHEKKELSSKIWLNPSKEAERLEKIRQVDEEILKRQYRVKVHECVISTLWRSGER